jgi:hypothetical protein
MDLSAKDLIKIERESLKKQYPEGYGVLVQHNKITYFGSLQHIFPDYDKKDGIIVLLSKYSKPISLDLVNEILMEQPKRQQFIASKELNLEKRIHILRRDDNFLKKMTTKQKKYVRKCCPQIIENYFSK